MQLENNVTRGCKVITNSLLFKENGRSFCGKLIILKFITLATPVCFSNSRNEQKNRIKENTQNATEKLFCPLLEDEWELLVC